MDELKNLCTHASSRHPHILISVMQQRNPIHCQVCQLSVHNEVIRTIHVQQTMSGIKFLSLQSQTHTRCIIVCKRYGNLMIDYNKGSIISIQEHMEKEATLGTHYNPYPIWAVKCCKRVRHCQRVTQSRFWDVISLLIYDTCNPFCQPPLLPPR